MRRCPAHSGISQFISGGIRIAPIVGCFAVERIVLADIAVLAEVVPYFLATASRLSCSPLASETSQISKMPDIPSLQGTPTTAPSIPYSPLSLSVVRDVAPLRTGVRDAQPYPSGWPTSLDRSTCANPKHSDDACLSTSRAVSTPIPCVMLPAHEPCPEPRSCWHWLQNSPFTMIQV